MAKESSLPNRQEWLRRWDQMQTNYLPDEAALQRADFREVGVIWQDLDNRVLMAAR